MNVIQVYAPTADKDDQEVEMFYEQINEILKQVKAKDVTIIMGDLNAKVGKGKTNNLMGNFGLGERNDRETRERVKNKINGALQTLQCIENNNEEHINNNWLQFKTEILKTCKEQLSKKTEVRKEWMTTEILGLMDERRTYKNKDLQKYRYLQSKIRSKIREAKENWHREKCEEIEKLQSKHDGFNAHKRIKELTNKRNYNNNLLVDENGDIIMDTKEKLKVWKNYVEQLYEDQRDEESSEYVCDDIGPEITKDEVEHIIKEMKTGKATGLDEIPAEVLKLIDNHNIHLLTHLFNSVYKTGILPKEWLQSTFITIPKKTNARQCSDHRTISLMCHILKVASHDPNAPAHTNARLRWREEVRRIRSESVNSKARTGAARSCPCRPVVIGQQSKGLRHLLCCVEQKRCYVNHFVALYEPRQWICAVRCSTGYPQNVPIMQS
ncbi:uncharacterized protein LOC132698660 [Cylas formicarius]|uniref:uncharacterized protein LOC132698660 n=1 Tax=Cylas formicarius TaxID=197179 RepID=UPI002958A42B|nr:uncharacterized protein LOC132698660 [Cylas formicarius]